MTKTVTINVVECSQVSSTKKSSWSEEPAHKRKNAVVINVQNKQMDERVNIQMNTIS